MNPEDQIPRYVSSAPLFAGTDESKPQDDADIATIEQMFKILENRRAYYEAISSLSLEDKTFTIEQQLAINRKVLFHVQELESLLMATINKVRRKLNGRG